MGNIPTEHKEESASDDVEKPKKRKHLLKK